MKVKSTFVQYTLCKLNVKNLYYLVPVIVNLSYIILGRGGEVGMLANQ